MSTADLVTNIQGYSIHDGPGIRTVVFFKGCGLACQWCSNPECISPRPEIGFIKTLCTRCGKCDGVCPEKALTLSADKLPVINREKCNGCGECVAACTYKSLILYGKPMNAVEIFDAVSRDKMFYESSGGGVTVSGGEALLHFQTVAELFDKCRKAGINTCVETSGFAAAPALKYVLDKTDYVLFDLKLMNTEKHRRYTGKPNGAILENARFIAEIDKETLFRMPLIPGINCDEQNIKDTADFLHGLGKNYLRIELMPYHALGKGKYESLDRKYLLPDIRPSNPEQVESVKKMFENLGIACTVSW